MNFLKAITVGFQVLAALAALQSGQPTPPFKIDNDWYQLQEVPAPALPKK